MRTYKISEEQFWQIKNKQKRWKHFNDFKSFLEEKDLLMFYDKIPSSVSKLNYDIYVGGCLTYILYNHPMWIMVEYGGELLPFSISLIPQLLVNNKNNIESEKNIVGIKSFITRNFYCLSEYAKMNIDFNTFLSFLNRENLNESMLLTEMPVLTTAETGLPTNIWVDGERQMQHGPRLKFKSFDDNNTRTWSTCTINDNPEIKNLSPKCKLSGNDLKKIINFVSYNKDLLLNLANGTEGLIKSEDVLKRIIKVGKNGGPIYSREMFDEPLYADNNERVINVYIDHSHEGLIFVFKGDEKQVQELVKIVSQSSKFKYTTPHSVSYTRLQYEPSGIIEWRCEMKALTQLKEIASSNGYNIKFN